MTNIHNSLTELFERDLLKLKHEINLYDSEADLWKTSGGITNSSGNLACHLVGNLNHFIGATLGGSSYIRDRHAEFHDKGVPCTFISEKIDEAIEMINSIVPDLSSKQLQAIYPIDVFGRPMTTEFFLIHLHSHLNYHLGQINYHRRLLIN